MASKRKGRKRARSRTDDNESLYIVGPAYDWLLFLGSPIGALAIGFWASGSILANTTIDFHGFAVTRSEVLLGILVHAHLFAVFFRSHGNRQIFEAHRFRFLVVPVALYGFMITSQWIFVAVSVTATFWDVYHSSMQTFGFGRIYDRKVGNDALVGRRLDWALNVLLYTGPILGGATMMDHFEDFYEFHDVNDIYFTRVPAMMEGIHGTLAVVVLAAGSVFVVFYLVAYFRLAKQGYRVSWLKVWLYASTGVTSIYAWGFNAFGEAFLIMNLFHAVQYFGIVWAHEKNQLQARLRLSGIAWGKPTTLFVLLALTGAYGYAVEAVDSDANQIWAVTLVVSIMHFWYDGFIWSVRRNEV